MPNSNPGSPVRPRLTRTGQSHSMDNKLSSTTGYGKDLSRLPAKSALPSTQRGRVGEIVPVSLRASLSQPDSDAPRLPGPPAGRRAGESTVRRSGNSGVTVGHRLSHVSHESLSKLRGQKAKLPLPASASESAFVHLRRRSMERLRF